MVSYVDEGLDELPEGFVVKRSPSVPMPEIGSQGLDELPEGFVVTSVQEDPNLLQRLGGIPMQQYRDVRSSIDRSGRGEITDVETALKAASSISVPFEMAGELLGSGAGYVGRGLQEAFPETTGRIVESVKQDPVFKAVERGAESIGEGLASFQEKYPRLYESIGDITRTALSGPAAKISSTGIPGQAVSAVGRGAVAGATSPFIVAGSIKKRLLPEKVIKRMSADELRDKAGEAFDLADEMGANLNPKFIKKFVKSAKSLGTQERAAKIVMGEDEFEKALTRIQALAKDPQVSRRGLSFRAVKEIDEGWGKKAAEHLDQKGRYTATGRQYLALQDALRDTVRSATAADALNTKGFRVLELARDLWKRSIHLSDIETILDNAQFSQRPDRALQSGFAALAKNKKRMNMYSPKQQMAIRSAARTGNLNDIYETFGSRLLPYIGGAASGPVGAIAGFVGSKVSRGYAEQLRRDVGEQVKDLILRNE